MNNLKDIKIMILTDSVGNPRSFPAEDAVSVEESYPYLLRDEFKNAVFWQLSYGGMEAQDIINSAIGYLNDWKPDIIIVQLGIIDCRTEALSEFQKLIITKFSGPFFKFIKKHLYNPKLIKNRKLTRVSKSKFKKVITKLSMVFEHSKILWLEISINPAYENARPGTIKRVANYNKIILDALDNELVLVQNILLDNNGFNSDNLHVNKIGHILIAKELKFSIDNYIHSNFEKK